MLSLVKGILVSSLGIRGVGVALYGALSSSSAKEIKRKDLKIISSGPVLICDDKYDKYEFFLEPVKGSEVDLGTDITLRVYRTSTSNAGDKKIIPWGSKATENHAWSNWKMTFKEEKIGDVWTKDVGMIWYTSNHIIQGCADKGQHKIQLVDSSKNQGDNAGIEGTTIKLEIKEETCTQISNNTKECDIIFSSDSNLKWKEGFQPKIRYTSIAN
ncbi:hypothetical protein DNK47_02750 [Mycoplasma wenyonii]|uniref:Uncharacterized protein n=1 Tax=Mycoplasma wenyonii TaxID=65123 RepID=A0A328PJ76_9MOLU|nr:hypothetical protein [Mycoplasma wenyonii]RAO94862.1 hypothetical protein DNK47_02750 [Mycoplasma wenyonii]